MSKRSCAAAESAESAVLRMARVNVRFRLPAAYCQHVFKLHFAAEQIQCAANCHIDVVVSQFLSSSRSSNFPRRRRTSPEIFHLRKQFHQLRLNAGSLSLDIHGMDQELITVF